MEFASSSNVITGWT